MAPTKRGWWPPNPADDEATMIAKALARVEGAFSHVISHKKALPEIVNDVMGEGYIVNEVRGEFEIRRVSDDTTLAYVRTARRSREVILDVSNVIPGSGGAAIYQVVGDFAHNNGMVFIGDPLGLSPLAQIRRALNMLCSALRHGTAAHLGSHELLEFPEVVGAEPVDWWQGHDEHNLRALIASVVKTYRNLVPEICDLCYNWAHRRFEDAHGQPISDLDFDRISQDARRRTLDDGSGGGGLADQTPAGRRTLKTVTLLQSGIPGLHGPGLVEFSNFLSELTSADGPALGALGLAGILYSRGGASGPLGVATAPVWAPIVRSWLDPLTDAVKATVDVHIVEDVRQLRRVLQRGDIPENVHGLYSAADSAVWLVAKSLTSKEKAEAAFMHEVVGHLAVERYGKVDQAIDLVLAGCCSEPMNALWAKISRLQPGLQKRSHAREVIALIAESTIGFVLVTSGMYEPTVRSSGIAGTQEVQEVLVAATQELLQAARGYRAVAADYQCCIRG